MGVPTSEVGYTSAMPRREDHAVHKGLFIWMSVFRDYGGIVLAMVNVLNHFVIR